MGHKVLVVDDSRTSRLFIIQALEMAGLGGSEFVEASNGEDALAKLQADAGVEFLVTDINMPQKCGMTMLKELRDQKLHSSLKIIVISSTQNPVRDLELTELGAAAILQKPIQMPKLIAVLSTLKLGA